MTGSWFHCSGCDVDGDMLQLAMLILQVDATTAIKMLRAKACFCKMRHIKHPVLIRAYEETIVAQRNQVTQYHKLVTNYVPDDDFKALHTQMQIDPSIAPDKWKAVMSNFVGHCDGDATRKIFIVQTGHSSAVVAPPKWKKYMVVTYHDLPHRICGFQLFNASLTDKEKKSYCPVNKLFGEAGLSFYDNLSVINQQFEETAFILDSIEHSIRIQFKWSKDNSKPLPLGSFYNSGTEASTSSFVWHNLPKRDWVLWGESPSKELFNHAACSGGRIVLGQIDEKYTNKPVMWLHNIKRRARPWDKALEAYMPMMSDKLLKQILFNLDLDTEGWRRFLSDMGREARRRVTTLRQLEWPTKRIRLSSNKTNRQTEVVETTNGWMADGVMIFNGRLHVSMIWMDEFGEVWAKGWIYYGKRQEVPFMAKETTLRDSGPYGIQKVITEASLRENATLPIFEPFWVDKLYSLSMMFRRPRVQRNKLTPNP
jgi:hypothetical protein